MLVVVSIFFGILVLFLERLMEKENLVFMIGFFILIFFGLATKEHLIIEGIIIVAILTGLLKYLIIRPLK
jgi:hypothetical protein